MNGGFTARAVCGYPEAMLLLKKHLVELVRAGKKHQTIRVWDRPHVRVGQISYTPGLGKLKITGIDELPHLDALIPADAIADGFATLPELLREIHRSYPEIPAGKRLFRVTFQWPWPPTADPITPETVPPPQSAPPRTSAAQRRPASARGPDQPDSAPAVTADPPTCLTATAAQRAAVKSWVLSQIEENDATVPGNRQNSPRANRR